MNVDKFYVDKASIVGGKIHKSVPFYMSSHASKKNILVGKSLLRGDIILGLPDDYLSVIVSNNERSIHVCSSQHGTEQLRENVIFRGHRVLL